MQASRREVRDHWGYLPASRVLLGPDRHQVPHTEHVIRLRHPATQPRVTSGVPHSHIPPDHVAAWQKLKPSSGRRVASHIQAAGHRHACTFTYQYSCTNKHDRILRTCKKQVPPVPPRSGTSSTFAYQRVRVRKRQQVTLHGNMYLVGGHCAPCRGAGSFGPQLVAVTI